MRRCWATAPGWVTTSLDSVLDGLMVVSRQDRATADQFQNAIRDAISGLQQITSRVEAQRMAEPGMASMDADYWLG